MSKVVHNKEFQHKCNRPHDFHFTEGHQEYLVAHSADVQGNVVADHGVNHEKGKTHVLFVIKRTLVSFPILYQS